MRHGKKRHQLNRFTSWHKATLNSLVKSLLIHQSIRTTLARAKAARPLAEKLINLAKENSLDSRRRAFQILGDHKLVQLLFREIGPRFAGRAGGYIRIIQLLKRRGDNAQVAILELVEIKKKEIKKIKKHKETAAATETQGSPKKTTEEKPAEVKKEEAPAAVKQKPPITKKPNKKFLGGLRNIFKKERDSL
ncbi:MAG: 50S ribosomal protein L17 [Candidatus Omnitrophota bacterium]|nr:50S ribosomal protein L17 [Candidatus Omnitrophota bacterium]